MSRNQLPRFSPLKKHDDNWTPVRVSMVISRSRKRVAISRKEAMVVEVKDMGVSINGSPKWLVYNGKSY